MNFLSVGDLAQSFLLNRQNTQLKTQLSRLSQELTTGQVGDVSSHLKGDLGPLSELEHSLRTLGSYTTATAEAAAMTEAMQTSLTQVGDASQSLTSGLLVAVQSRQPATFNAIGIDAETRLQQVFSALNAEVSGKGLFSGADVQAAALSSSEQMLDDLRALAAGQATAQGVADVVAAWFDPGGGFETQTYTGAASAAGPARLSENVTLALDVAATDPALRDMIKGLATAALLSDDSMLGGDLQARADLAGTAAETLLAAEGGLATLAGRVGSAQSRIEDLQAEHATQISALEQLRADLIGADPYETATRLQDAQYQLETLYTLTARLSRLSLADYLS